MAMFVHGIVSAGIHEGCLLNTVYTDSFSYMAFVFSMAFRFVVLCDTRGFVLSMAKPMQFASTHEVWSLVATIDALQARLAATVNPAVAYRRR
jgi:hypothetical protein